MLPIEALSALFPGAKPGLLALIDAHLAEAQLNTVQRQAAFLAQTSYATMGFRCLKEVVSSQYLQRYEGRKDLENTQRGDGHRYCSRGLIPITGRRQYGQLEVALRLPLLEQPTLLEEPEIALQAALWFWNTQQQHRKTCNELADADDFTGLTRLIMGSLKQYADRRKWLLNIRHILEDFQRVVILSRIG